MLKTSNKVETNVYELEIAISGEAFEAAIQKAYLKQRKNIAINGFRKGKAPRAFIERVYGEGVFYEDALEILYPDAVAEAIKEAELDVIDTPFDLDVPEIGKDGVTLKLKVTVKPEVKLGKYKGVKATKPAVKVSADEVKAELAKMQEQNSRMVSVDNRAVKNGDTTVIDFEGFVDGVAFEGGKGENHDLKLGSGSFIPGFEAQIEGKSIGEEFDVNVTFPKNYGAKELAGKAATFKTKLNALKVEELPEADDDFAKDVSEFDTLDEYKADVKAKLATKKADLAEKEFEDALVNALLEKLVAEIPEPMFEAETENFLRDYDNRLRMQGLDLSKYTQYTGVTIDALRAQFRPNAEKQVKLRLALEKIAELEALTVTDEEIDAEYTRISEAYNVPADQVKAMVSSEDIKADMLVANAMKFVKDNAVIA